MTNKIKQYPAPWDLNGKGYIIIYKLSKDFVDKYACTPNFLKGKFLGGFGALMLVDYKNSNAGPYKEMLFIPGKFKYKNKRLNTISKIYVSTMESVVNGRNNWGIPKEKADFNFEKLDSNIENICVFTNNTNIAKFKIKTGKLQFPVSTKLMPFPLVQEYNDKIYYTNFYGSGTGRLCSIKDIQINANMFPCIDKCKPLLAIEVDPFNITFPEANIE